jgi:hypothetical protein
MGYARERQRVFAWASSPVVRFVSTVPVPFSFTRDLLAEDVASLHRHLHHRHWPGLDDL